MDTAHLLQQVGRNFQPFDTADAAVARITELYDHAAELIRHAFSTRDTTGLADAVYPYLAFMPQAALPSDGPRPPFDVVLEPGFYGTTLTRPALFADYWREQIESLLRHYRTPVMVGLSKQPIPLSYVMEEAVTSLTELDLAWIQSHFALPDLHVTDNSIANCDYIPVPACRGHWRCSRRRAPITRWRGCTIIPARPRVISSVSSC